MNEPKAQRRLEQYEQAAEDDALAQRCYAIREEMRGHATPAIVLHLFVKEEIARALRAAPRSEGAMSEAEIEKAARFFANAYIRGFRGASSLAKATPVEAWVDENWESFCTEATEFLAALAPRSETEGRDKERWRPMDTAPTDGTPFLAYASHWGKQPRITQAWGGFFIWTSGGRCHPDCWMPLPKPPTA